MARFSRHELLSYIDSRVEVIANPLNFGPMICHPETKPLLEEQRKGAKLALRVLQRWMSDTEVVVSNPGSLFEELCEAFGEASIRTNSAMFAAERVQEHLQKRYCQAAGKRIDSGNGWAQCGINKQLHLLYGAWFEIGVFIERFDSDALWKKRRDYTLRGSTPGNTTPA